MASIANKFKTKKKGSKSFNIFALIGALCGGERKPILKNELSEMEIVSYWFFIYLFAGNLYYLHFGVGGDPTLMDIHKQNLKDGVPAPTGSTADQIYWQIVTMASNKVSSSCCVNEGSAASNCCFNSFARAPLRCAVAAAAALGSNPSAWVSMISSSVSSKPATADEKVEGKTEDAEPISCAETPA